MSTSPIVSGGNQRLALSRHHSSENSATSREEKDSTPAPKHNHILAEGLSQQPDRFTIRETAPTHHEHERQSAQSTRALASTSAGSEQTWTTFFSKLNPVRAYQEAKAQHRLNKQKKTERKQQAALKQQRANHAEANLANYYTAIDHLKSKLLNKDAPLTIQPDSIGRQETERLLSWTNVDHTRFPIYQRQADVKAGDTTYHLELTEMRKADPNQLTSHPWMYPTDKPPYHRQDIREQDPPSRYKDNTVITFELTGPNHEKLNYDRYPKPDPLCVTADYTEVGGEKQHHRSVDRHFHPKDQTLLSLTHDIRSAVNQAEVKRLINQRIPEPTTQELLQTRLDAAVTDTPQIPSQSHKLTKQQKQALKQYQAAFYERKHTIEKLIPPLLTANAEYAKIAAAPRRSAELTHAEETLQTQFTALVDALNTEAPKLVLPEKRTTGCLPHKG